MKVLRTNASVFVWEIICERRPALRNVSDDDQVDVDVQCVARSAQDAINMLKAVDSDVRITTVRRLRGYGAHFGVLVDATALPTVAQSVPEITKKTKRRNRAAKTTKS